MNNFSQANKYFLQEEYQNAIRYYIKSIEDNQFYFYYENLATAYRKICKFEEANINYRKALCLNPTSTYSMNELRSISKILLEDTTRPLLSIIVPVHNTEKYLEKCISSILNQTLIDLELIIINDGSSDNSLQIINKFMANDSRIKLINNEKASGNPGTPRNQGIKIAHGHYLGFVDSDDWIDENMYQSLIDNAIENNSDMVFSGGFKNYLNGEIDTRVYDNSLFNDTYSKYFKYHESFMIWDKIFKTDLIKTFNIRLGETKAAVDVPFIFKAYYYLHNTSFCKSLIAYNYRRESDTSVTVNFRKGSDCSFELDAYHNIEEWAKNDYINENYRDLISIKKISSYIYTLKIIAPDMFVQFYNKVKKEILNIDREIVNEFTIRAKKRYILKMYDDICSLDAEKYAEKYRNDIICNLDTEKYINKDKYIPATFELSGLNKGILFFPEWTWSNPYQKLMYTELNAKYNINTIGYKPEFFRKDILRQNRVACEYIHLHWIHLFMDTSQDSGIVEFIDTIRYAKSLGYKFIYTAHNVISHDTKFYDRELKFRKRIIKEFDYLLAHGVFAKEKLINEIGANPSKVYIIEHGTYEDFYLNTISRVEAQKLLEIDAKDFVFLFLGNIKGYKGIKPLLKSFNKVSNKTANAKLIIAGKLVDNESKEIIENAVLLNKNIIFRPGFVKDKDIQVYFNACDIMVLPYKQILTSGAALLSMTFKKPIIAPNTGLLPELISSKQGYLFNTYDEMTSIMQTCLYDFNNNKWHSIVKGFEFEKLKKNLKWETILAKKPFSQIFKKTF